MKYLKRFNKINESSKNDFTKSLLRDGFEILMDNTHLVQEQVRDNLDKFLNKLDINKLESKFGKIIKFLGAGVFGVVFQLYNGKIIKITFDFHEAPFLYKYCKLQKTKGFVKIDYVYKIKFGNTNAYIIIRNPVGFKNMSKKDLKKAKDAMYKISPVWRGTHIENFGEQDDEIVLYDGFCKKAPVDEKSIPFLDIEK